MSDNTNDAEYFKIVDNFTKQTFLPLLDTSFTINFDSGESLALKLSSVDVLSKHYDKSDHSFTLTFIGANEYPLQQSIYPVEHEALGKFPLFLVPIAQDEQGYSYESVFARMPEDK